MSTAPDALTIFCDASCPVCSLEMGMLRRRDVAGRLRWVDISAPGFDASAHGFLHRDLDAVIHGVRADGQVVRGLDVLRQAYGAAGLGRWVALTRWPGLRAPSDAAYRLFARHRHAISHALAPWLRRIARVRQESGS